MANDSTQTTSLTPNKIVHSAAELATALKCAVAGDVIALTAGNYGDLVVNRMSFPANVTITSLDSSHEAVFSSIKVLNSKGVTFDHVDVEFKPNATTIASSSAVTISSSSSIAFTNSTLHGGPAVNGVDPSAAKLDSTGNVKGLPAGRAFTIMNASDLTLSNNDMGTFHKGVVLNNVNGIKISGNDIHDLRTTPVSGGSVSNATITGNHMHDFSPWHFGGTGDHGDYIHLWTVPGQPASASANVMISDNFLDQGNHAPLLGIYLDDNKNGIGFSNVSITNNVISNTNAQAVRLENVKGVVSHNTMVQAQTTTYHDIPGVLALDGSHVTLADNLLGRVTVDTNSTLVDDHNTMISRLDPSAPGYYAKVFANGMADHPTLADLTKLSNSSFASLGASLSGADVAHDVGQAGALPPSGAHNVDQGDTLPPSGAHNVDQGGTLPPSGAHTIDQGGTVATTPVETAPAAILKNGTAGHDSLSDGGKLATLVGLGGADSYAVSNGHTTITEGANGGVDTVSASVDFTLSANVENLTLTGAALNGTGNDLANSIKANNHGDTLHGMGGDDLIAGGTGADHLFGDDGNDSLSGNNGDDLLDGGNGNDALAGGNGNDVLQGGAGDDRLTGGSGGDTMTGGAGADKFLFNPGDFGVGSKLDWITDFSSAQGDKICLNAIDAKIATAQDDKFTWLGEGAFTHHAGELHYAVVGHNTYVSGDVNGDGVADFTIALTGAVALHASDFIL